MADYVHAFALILSQQIVTIPYGHQFSSPASIPLLHMRQVQCLSQEGGAVSRVNDKYPKTIETPPPSWLVM